MSGFVEVGFPFSGLGQSKGAPTFTDMQQRLHASSNASPWSFLTASTGQHPHFQPTEQMPMMHQCRKRSYDQASHANDHTKRVRTEKTKSEKASSRKEKNLRGERLISVLIAAKILIKPLSTYLNY